MTDVPAERPTEDQLSDESLSAQLETLKADEHVVSEATHRHLEEVLKPSLLPTPNSGDDLPPESEDDDFPSTGHPSHP